jgi:hypothetical protein
MAGQQLGCHRVGVGSSQEPDGAAPFVAIRRPGPRQQSEKHGAAIGAKTSARASFA